MPDRGRPQHVADRAADDDGLRERDLERREHRDVARRDGRHGLARDRRVRRLEEEERLALDEVLRVHLRNVRDAVLVRVDVVVLLEFLLDLLEVRPEHLERFERGLEADLAVRLDGRDDGRELAAEEAHEDADQDAEELLGVVGLERLPERQSALDRQDGKRRQRVDRRAEVTEGQRRDVDEALDLRRRLVRRGLDDVRLARGGFGKRARLADAAGHPAMHFLCRHCARVRGSDEEEVCGLELC
mmetsp:Transcript_3875/g.12037  ORF Transcript_3875/g.12037 Transcript_3875/m.12037 type:complete len:244 (-) Transcript_3875:298-1029(-)